MSNDKSVYNRIIELCEQRNIKITPLFAKLDIATGSSSIRTVLTEPKLSFVNILILFSDIKMYLRKKVLTKTEVYDRI